MNADQSQAADMRAVLIKLECLSYGTTTSWDSNGGGESDSDRPRGGDLEPLHEKYARDFNRAGSFQARERVLEEARGELAAERVSSADRGVEESAESLTARIRELRAGGWSVREVALHCRCTPTRVRQADRDVTAARVQELVAQGYSVRQIAVFAGVSKSAAQRIKDAA